MGERSGDRPVGVLLVACTQPLSLPGATGGPPVPKSRRTTRVLRLGRFGRGQGAQELGRRTRCVQCSTQNTVVTFVQELGPQALVWARVRHHTHACGLAGTWLAEDTTVIVLDRRYRVRAASYLRSMNCNLSPAALPRSADKGKGALECGAARGRLCPCTAEHTPHPVAYSPHSIPMQNPMYSAALVRTATAWPSQGSLCLGPSPCPFPPLLPPPLFLGCRWYLCRHCSAAGLVGQIFSTAGQKHHPEPPLTLQQYSTRGCITRSNAGPASPAGRKICRVRYDSLQYARVGAGLPRHLRWSRPDRWTLRGRGEQGGGESLQIGMESACASGLSTRETWTCFEGRSQRGAT